MSDPDLFDRAAAGDAEAQFEMSNEVMRCAEGGLLPLDEAIVASGVWMRMAARSGSIENVRTLAGHLLARGAIAEDGKDAPTALGFYSEALNLLNICADQGDEMAAEALAVAGEWIMPEALHAAAYAASAIKDIGDTPEPRGNI